MVSREKVMALEICGPQLEMEIIGQKHGQQKK